MRQRSVLRSMFAPLLGLLLTAPDVEAQAGTSSGSSAARDTARTLVLGSVDDSTGAPLRDVEIDVDQSAARGRPPVRLRVVTNEIGRFRIVGLPPGSYAMRARRLGFEPVRFELEVSENDTALVAVELKLASAGATTTGAAPRDARQLAQVDVTADAVSARLFEVGFERRRKYGGVPPSQFVTRDEIEKRNPIVLSQMIRNMSGRAQTCVNGLVFVDGVRMGTLLEAEEGQRDTVNASRVGPATRMSGLNALGFDATPPARAKEQIDFIPPRQVEGMEVYVGAAQIPPQYKTAGRANSTAACVILIWTG